MESFLGEQEANPLNDLVEDLPVLEHLENVFGRERLKICISIRIKMCARLFI
jgi:hypothetical protein